MKNIKSNLFFFLFFSTLMLTGLYASVQPVFSPLASPQDSRTFVEIPILMYHGISAPGTQESEYVVSASRLENDLVWLKEHGYTSILPSRLLSYVESGAKLPEKPVILSFDDGYCNNYFYAFPLLEKYQAKAVIALIGRDTEQSSDDIYRVSASGTLNFGEVAIMAESGLVEFASHTYNLHHIADGRKGADRKSGESEASYREILQADLLKNQTLIASATGKAPSVFAWPYGAYPSDSCADPILKACKIPISFTSYQRTSVVRRGDRNSLYGLGRYLRTPQFDLCKILPPAADS